MSDTVSEKASDTKRRKPAAPKPKPPTALELLETDIERQEATVAELESALAEDWADVDKLTAHRLARDDLQRLLARWEELLETQV